MGVLNPHHLSTTYLQELRNPAGLAGNVGIVSQSGGFCISLLSDTRRFGFSHVVSSGNEAVLAAADYLEYLVEDPRTEAIGAFIETIRQPDRFTGALDRAAAMGKPVVVLKVGRSERTRRAVSTHTGGMAGASEAASALLHAHRAIEVSDLTEFTEVLAACQGATRATGRRIGIVTSSGGLAEMILDIADAAALELPPLSAAARDDIVARIGFITGDGNPLDAWGGGTFVTNLPQALSLLDASPTTTSSSSAVTIVTIRRSIRPSWYAGISTCLPVPRRKAASRTICCTPGLVSWIGRWWRNCASTALR
jgi:acyl-CoA synthetase (NDP forming)